MAVVMLSSRRKGKAFTRYTGCQHMPKEQRTAAELSAMIGNLLAIQPECVEIRPSEEAAWSVHVLMTGDAIVLQGDADRIANELQKLYDLKID